MKKQTIAAKVNPEMKKKILEKCKEKNCSISDYIRERLTEGKTIVYRDKPAEIVEVEKEKKVFIDKPVEKIVYREKMGNIIGGLSLFGVLLIMIVGHNKEKVNEWWREQGLHW